MLSCDYIRYFLAACDCGSIQSASKKLYLSSQGLGAGIQRLENALGMKLLIRSKAGITPTQFGRQFYEYAARVSESMKELEDFCAAYSASRKASVNIGFVGESRYPGTIALCAEKFNNDFPDSPLNVTTEFFGHMDDLFDAFQSNEIDAAWIFHKELLPEYEYLIADDFSPLLLICSESNPVARQSAVTIGEMRALRFILSSEFDSITDVVQRLFTDSGETMHVAIYTTETALIGNIIDNNIANILVRRSYSQAILRDTRHAAAVPVAPEVRIANSLLYRKDGAYPPIKIDFFRYLAEYIRANVYSIR